MATEMLVSSRDGTELAVRVSGNGPPLVLVHGTTGTKDSWVFVEPALAEHHTVWAYDRRGRGGSGDAQAYNFDLEVDDLRAIVAKAGDSVHVAAHSFGARCAIEAAPQLPQLASLILYEPPVHVSDMGDLVDEAASHIEEGRVEEGLLLFFRSLAGFSDDEIEMVRSMPAVWERLLATAPTAAREARALHAKGWEPERHLSIDVPALFLCGGDTDLDVYPSREEQLSLLPDSQCAELPGQRHIAFATDPSGFTSAVLACTRR